MAKRIPFVSGRSVRASTQDEYKDFQQTLKINDYKMELSKTQKVLLSGLNLILENKDVILAIMLLLKSEEQMATMIVCIDEHKNETLSENDWIKVAQLISEEVK